MATAAKILGVLLATGIVSIAAAADRPLRIVNEGGWSKDWTPVGAVALPTVAPFPTMVKDRSHPVCVSIGYQLKRDGSTANFSLLKAWSGDGTGDKVSLDAMAPFGQMAAAVVSQWRFTAKEDASSNRVIYTSARLAFLADGGGDAVQVASNCAIDDLREFVARAKSDEMKRGDLENSKLDQVIRRSSPLEQAAQDNARRNNRGR